MKKNCFEFGSFLDNEYSGTADFGKAYTTVGVVITLFICIIFLIVGMVMVFKKNVYTKKTTMTVTGSTLNTSTGDWTITGNIKECTSTVTVTTSTPYTSGQTLTVYYNPSKTCDISSTTNYKGIGIAFIVIALLVGALSVINLFFVRKYKGVAAAEGVMDVFDMFRR